MNKNIYSVGQINNYIKRMFEQDYMLGHVYVRGEVSNCKYHSSGHIYFTLKDDTGVLQAVMFAGQRRSGLKFAMKPGDNVIVSGSVRIYERDGKYQLYAREIILEGAGLLYRQYEELKERLSEMGMFAPEYKKPIPKYAMRIGVVTAPTGAAVHDIINISRRRNPYVQLILYPAKVQGEGSAESVCAGIRALEDLGVDVMIVGRGGGSIEDLWAFNEEAVARAIFACRVPVISAVGHETDVTISDFVADMRAPTPSAAAELAVFDVRAVLESIKSLELDLGRRMEQKTGEKRSLLDRYAMRLKLSSPENRLMTKKNQLADYDDRVRSIMRERFEQSRHRTELLAASLEGVSPLRKLAGGYALVSDDEGKLVKRAEDIDEQDVLRLSFADGDVLTKAIEKQARKPVV